MRNGYTIVTLTFVDIQEFVKTGGISIKIYKSVSYKANLKVFPLKEVIDKLFNLCLKYKDEGNGLMQVLVKLIFSSL